MNFVNIDIQGAELKALKGMKKYLENVDYLYLEVDVKELYEGCCLLSEINEFLKGFGFEQKEISLTQHGWEMHYISKINKLYLYIYNFKVFSSKTFHNSFLHLNFQEYILSIYIDLILI